MKPLSLLIITILFFNCTKQKHASHNYTKNKEQHLTDNNNILKDSSHFYKKDSAKENKIETHDIKIIRATIRESSYSDHKDIEIVFKNTSKKTIKAIKFEWSCVNSFDEPANGKYFYGEGNYKEKSTILLKPGQTQTEYWEDFSTDADKVTKIKATYIVYTDGTKWQLHN